MRRLSWMLWLLIALMPVRGVAQSLMVGGAFDHGAAVTAGSADAPCPMHGAQAPAVDAKAVAADGDGTPHVCSLCNVCHSAVLPLALPLERATAVHEAAPLAALGLGAGRAAPSELFRPPRQS